MTKKTYSFLETILVFISNLYLYISDIFTYFLLCYYKGLEQGYKDIYCIVNICQNKILAKRQFYGQMDHEIFFVNSLEVFFSVVSPWSELSCEGQVIILLLLVILKGIDSIWLQKNVIFCVKNLTHLPSVAFFQGVSFLQRIFFCLLLQTLF